MFRNIHCLVLSLTVLAGGCSTTGPESTSLAWVRPPVGSRVQLNQELGVEAGTRFTVQYGKPTHRNAVTPVDPYCYFRVRRTPEEIAKPTFIAADTFSVTRVYRQLEYSALEPVRYAYSGPDLLFAQSFNNGASNAYLSTFLELSSADQPRVKTLVCTRWDIPAEQNFLSIDEMREALGAVAEIMLPGSN